MIRAPKSPSAAEPKSIAGAAKAVTAVAAF
jgi:hypothetical protein